jgi:hypothetical protein
MVSSRSDFNSSTGGYSGCIDPKQLTYPIKIEIRQATVVINRILKRSVKKSIPKGPAPNWRVKDSNFMKKNLLEPGAVTFSAGWFAQGHVVGLKFCLMIGDHWTLDVTVWKIFFEALKKPPRRSLSGIL